MITFDFKDILEASSLFFATCNIAAKYPSKKKKGELFTPWKQQPLKKHSSKAATKSPMASSVQAQAWNSNLCPLPAMAQPGAEANDSSRTCGNHSL